MKIGISGFGFVGSALYSNIRNKNNIRIYDPKFKEHNNKERLLDTDVVFICVGTPLKYNKIDAKAVNDNLEFLSMNDYSGLVVIKSTIHPDYIFGGLLENLNFVSNPEFLNEYNAIEDFKNRKLNIIGGRVDLCNKLKDIYDLSFDLKCKYEFMSFEEALVFKYIRNIKLAYEVMFWEFVQEPAGNYRKYNTVMDKLPINVKHIGIDSKRGFGGHCLPKDIKSYPENDLTDFLLDYNKRIR